MNGVVGNSQVRNACYAVAGVGAIVVALSLIYLLGVVFGNPSAYQFAASLGANPYTLGVYFLVAGVALMLGATAVYHENKVKLLCFINWNHSIKRLSIPPVRLAWKFRRPNKCI